MAADALDVDDLVFDLKSSEDFVGEDKNFDPFKTSSTNDSSKELNGHNKDVSQDNFPDLLGSSQSDEKNVKNVLNDPFGALSQGDSLSTNTVFDNDPFSKPPSQISALNNDPFGNLGSIKPPTENQIHQIPDPFSNNNFVKDPFQDLEGNLPSLSINPNEIGSFTKQVVTDPFSALKGDNPDLLPETTHAAVDPFVSKTLQENAASDPFGTANPSSNSDPFRTANPLSNLDPFGAENPSSNPDPFGTANPSSNPDPFGTANPPGNQDPFGTANPPSIPDPFGTANSSSNPDLFGTANPPSNPDPFGTANPPSIPDPFGTANPSSNPDPFGTGLDPVSSSDPFGATNPSNSTDPFGTGLGPISVSDPFGTTNPPGKPDSDPFGTIQTHGTNLLENGNQDPFGETFSSVKTTEIPSDPFPDLGSLQTPGNAQNDPFGADFAGDISKDKNHKDADPFSSAPYKSQSTFPDATEIQPPTSEPSPNHSKSSNVVLNYDDIFGDDPFHGNSKDQSKDSLNELNSQSNHSSSILNTVETKNDPEIEAAFNNSEKFFNTNDFIANKALQSGDNFVGHSTTFEQPMMSETKTNENPDLLEQASTMIPKETSNFLNQLNQNVPNKSQELNLFPSADKPNNVQTVPVNQSADILSPGVDVKPSLPDILPSLGLPDIHTSSQKSVDDVGVSISDVPLQFNNEVKNINGVESGVQSQDELIEDSVDLSQITTSLKDQKDEDESEFDFEAPVVPVPARPAPVAPSKPVPARPAPVSPARPAPVAPGTNRAAPVAPNTKEAAPAVSSITNVTPTPTQSPPDQGAPIAPIRTKRASSRDSSANVPDNTQTKTSPQSLQADEIKPNVITSTVEDWDNIQTIQPGFKGERPPEGDQTVSKSTPIYTYDEAYNTLQQADYTTVQNSLRTSVDRSGITAVVHFLFGPPKLNRDLIKGREFIFCLSASCLDNEQPSHSKMLQSIYRILTGSRFDSPRIGSHWEEIGFQGSDPATDLRGVGILGLVQLLYFLQHTKYGQIARDIYKLSLHPTQNFPFCVMGINISRICLQSLREDLLNKEMNKKKDVMTVVNDFYIGSYYYLYTLWKQGKTIADSGFVLKDVEVFAKKHTKDLIRNLETYKPGGGETTLVKTEGHEEFFSVCKE